MATWSGPREAPEDLTVGTAVSSSEWAFGPQLEAAARYVSAVRHASGGRARLTAAASREGATALTALLRALPVVRASFSESPDGQELLGWFGGPRRLPIDRAPVALLRLPGTHAEYLRGRPRQAMRTNIKRATAAGVVCTVVNDPHELARATGHLAAQRGQRVDHMLSPTSRAGLVRQASVAYDSAGDPVAMSETVLDGTWAGLGALVVTPVHPEAHTIRYLLHAHTVQRLIERQATMLTVGGSMLLTSEGTRYFQRRTGFTPVWLRPTPALHSTRRRG